MAKWVPTRDANGSATNASVAGFFRIYMARVDGLGQIGEEHDVTFVRGIPTELKNYSFADPFSDATALIRFPQLTGFDDLTSGEIGDWLTDFSAVRIEWCEMTAGTTVINPITNKRDLQAEVGETIWEGNVASFEIESTETSTSVTVQCVGALFQLDRYTARPFYPSSTWPNEALIADAFSKKQRPHLLTKQLQVEWPAGWARVLTKTEATRQLPYAIAGKVGEKITGWSTRNTGSGSDKMLTGYVQDLLSVMYTDKKSGNEASNTELTPGNQWTIRKDIGRRPVLYVRDKYAAPDFTIWYGTPGWNFRLSRDCTQFFNVIYGEGTNVDGSNWRRMLVTTFPRSGSRTSYLPLASNPSAYPVPGPSDPRNPALGGFVSEIFVKYGTGFDQAQAIEAAEKALARDSDPGYTGEIEIKTDPDDTTSRYKMKAGMNILVKGLVGTGENGILFHVAEVNVDVSTGTVSLKVDSKFRDLLTLEEVVARTRDPLTPSKILQVGKRSIMLEDQLLPWDYGSGSGFIPYDARSYFKGIVNTQAQFPWGQYVLNHRPRNGNTKKFISVNAKHNNSYKRWTVAKVRAAEKGTIRRIEISAYDANGNILPVPFHVSIYKAQKPTFPHKNSNYSPFQPEAFQETNSFGFPWSGVNMLGPDKNMIIGWGDGDQPAGYWPGRYSDGYPATGKFVDEGTWSFDLSTTLDKTTPGKNKRSTDGFMWIAIFCDTTAAGLAQFGVTGISPQPVYFIGRMYRQEPGT